MADITKYAAPQVNVPRPFTASGYPTATTGGGVQGIIANQQLARQKYGTRTPTGPGQSTTDYTRYADGSPTGLDIYGHPLYMNDGSVNQSAVLPPGMQIKKPAEGVSTLPPWVLAAQNPEEIVDEQGNVTYRYGLQPQGVAIVAGQAVPYGGDTEAARRAWGGAVGQMEAIPQPAATPQAAARTTTRAAAQGYLSANAKGATGTALTRARAEFNERLKLARKAEKTKPGYLERFLQAAAKGHKFGPLHPSR